MVKNYYKLKDYEAQRSIGYLVRRAGKVVTNHIEQLFVETDVSFTQWVILMNLRAGIVKTASELCGYMSHDSGALTRVLDQMAERGWITRTRSTQDRRVVELTLTDVGYTTTETYLPQVVELYNRIMHGFTREEADTLINLLTRLNKQLTELPKAKGA